MVGSSQSCGKPGDLICLCIGGRLFVTRRATLYRLPDSRLYLIATQGTSTQAPAYSLNLSDGLLRPDNSTNNPNNLSASYSSGRLIGNGHSEGAAVGGASILPDNVAAMLAGNMNLQSASSLCRNRGSTFVSPGSSVPQTPGTDVYRPLNMPVPVSPSPAPQFPLASNSFVSTPPVVYFYDRDPEIFRFVLDYYRTGELHLPSSICGPFVRKELIFWGIDESLIGPCCMPAYMRYDEEKRTKNTLFRDCFEDIDSMRNLVKYSRGWKKWRYRMWLFMDHPSSSLPAKIWATCLLVLMIASIMCYCLSTHDVFRMKSSVAETPNPHLPTTLGVSSPHVNTQNRPFSDVQTHTVDPLYRTRLTPQTDRLTHVPTSKLIDNRTIFGAISICLEATPETNPKILRDCSTEPTEGLVLLDMTLNCLFTLEFMLKVLLAPDKPKFLSSIVSILDMAILSSYWVYMSLFYYYYYHPKTSIETDKELKNELSGYLWLLNILSMTQAMRILRVFKISKISRVLRVLILTVKKSIPELVLLGFLLMNGMFLFSTLMYMAEYHVRDTFPDIPQSFWWSIITLTAVGYGDMHPKGGVGYFVGSLTAICGCIVTGLAIPIVGNNFNTYYKYMKNQLMEDKYLKNLRKDMEATGVSGSKSALGSASDKGGLPLPGRKPRNVNRKNIRGRITRTEKFRRQILDVIDVCTSPIRRFLPSRSTTDMQNSKLASSNKNTSDSLQMLTENQRIPKTLSSKNSLTEKMERKSSSISQHNLSVNLVNCTNKANGDRFDSDHRPSLIYPLATDQFLSSLLPSQLSLVSTPQIWVDGEELDDQLMGSSNPFENSGFHNQSSIGNEAGLRRNECGRLNPRMSVLSEEIIPNVTQFLAGPNASDISCTDCNVSHLTDGNSDSTSIDENDMQTDDLHSPILTPKQTHIQPSLSTARMTTPAAAATTTTTITPTTTNFKATNPQPIEKRMNYV